MLDLGALLRFEMKLMSKQRARLFMGCFFAVFCYVIFHLLLGAGQVSKQLFAAIFMMLNVFNVVNLAGMYFTSDVKSGFLLHYYVSRRELGGYCIAKLGSFMFLSVFMMIIALVIGALLFNLELQEFPGLLLIGLLQTLLLSMIGLICAAFSIHFSSQAYIYILILPFVAPSVVLAALSVEDIQYLKVMVGLLLIYVPAFSMILPLLLKQQLRYDG